MVDDSSLSGSSFVRSSAGLCSSATREMLVINLLWICSHQRRKLWKMVWVCSWLSCTKVFGCEYTRPRPLPGAARRQSFKSFRNIEVRDLEQEVQIPQLMMVNGMHVIFANEVYFSCHSYHKAGWQSQFGSACVWDFDRNRLNRHGGGVRQSPRKLIAAAEADNSFFFESGACEFEQGEWFWLSLEGDSGRKWKVRWRCYGEPGYSFYYCTMRSELTVLMVIVPASMVLKSKTEGSFLRKLRWVMWIFPILFSISVPLTLVGSIWRTQHLILGTICSFKGKFDLETTTSIPTV